MKVFKCDAIKDEVSFYSFKYEKGIILFETVHFIGSRLAQDAVPFLLEFFFLSFAFNSLELSGVSKN